MFIKRTISFFLILAFLVQALSHYIVIADYYMNTSAYVQNCVNKNKPCMHCNGKCQLDKKLKQQESSDKQNQERKSANNKSNPFLSKSWFAGSLFQNINSTNTQYPEFNCGKIKSRPRLFFHPPGLLAAWVKTGNQPFYFLL